MLRAFLVEDNSTIRQNLTETLEEMASADIVGFAVSEIEAIRWLRAGGARWDLAIVDLFLMQGSGLGVLTSIAHRPPVEKVVVLTNYATDEIRLRCEQLGADAVFDKSRELEAFIEYCVALGDARA